MFGVLLIAMAGIMCHILTFFPLAMDKMDELLS
jgi:hypothetical protein